MSIAATRYELYKAEDYDTFYNKSSFDNLNINGTEDRTNHSMIVYLLNHPQPPYYKERITIVLPDTDGTHVFGLKVFDDMDNESELSNLVSVRIAKPETQIADDNHLTTKIAVGVSVGVLALVIIVIVAIVLYKKKVSKKNMTTPGDNNNQQTYANKGFYA